MGVVGLNHKQRIGKKSYLNFSSGYQIASNYATNDTLDINFEYSRKSIRARDIKIINISIFVLIKILKLLSIICVLMNYYSNLKKVRPCLQ